MIDKSYWDITPRPHTRKKLAILERYLKEWGTIIFNQWIERKYRNFKIAYYIDCFAGRGKYHEGDRKDCVDGSPLIGLKHAIDFNRKFNGETELRCIFVDKNRDFTKQLSCFCKPYEKEVDINIFNKDINQIIDDILKITKSNATLFFLDPGGLKELEKETVEKIISKKGPNDLLLNYICGTKRVLGEIKKMALEGKIDERFFNLVSSITKFHGSDIILECFDRKEREILEMWIKEILKGTSLNYKSLYRMLHSAKREAVYYLFFASRSQIAKKVIDYIFKKEDSITYTGQLSLIPQDSFDF